MISEKLASSTPEELPIEVYPASLPQVTPASKYCNKNTKHEVPFAKSCPGISDQYILLGGFCQDCSYFIKDSCKYAAIIALHFLRVPSYIAVVADTQRCARFDR